MRGVRDDPRLPVAIAAGVFAATAGILVWNAAQFPWLQSYDAYASWLYTRVVADAHRLPSTSETDVWHNPPLFYFLAGRIEQVAGHVGFDTPEHAVQFMSVLAALGIVALSALMARELFPDGRWIWVLTLVLAALTPVLLRAGVQYHPEPLATVLTTAGLYVVVRALARGDPGWRTGLVAGLLLALANLTRTWALAAVAAAVVGLGLRWLVRRDQQSLVAGAVLVGVVAVIAGPWFVDKTVEHGSPLAYSRPGPEQWLQRGRPADFWIGLSVSDVFGHPYQPAFRNHLVPVLYADWWADYYRTYRVPPELSNEPDDLPAEYSKPLIRQAWIGLWTAALALAGLIALTVRAIRRRDEALATLLLSFAFLAASYAGFLWRYPKQDGDNIKALYVLNAVPVVAIAAAYSLERVMRGGPLLLLGAALATFLVAISTVAFVVLPHA